MQDLPPAVAGLVSLFCVRGAPRKIPGREPSGLKHDALHLQWAFSEAFSPFRHLLTPQHILRRKDVSHVDQ